jgi:hypothetical protein
VGQHKLQSARRHLLKSARLYIPVCFCLIRLRNEAEPRLHGAAALKTGARPGRRRLAFPQGGGYQRPLQGERKNMPSLPPSLPFPPSLTHSFLPPPPFLCGHDPACHMWVQRVEGINVLYKVRGKTHGPLGALAPPQCGHGGSAGWRASTSTKR